MLWVKCCIRKLKTYIIFENDLIAFYTQKNENATAYSPFFTEDFLTIKMIKQIITSYVAVKETFCNVT